MSLTIDQQTIDYRLYISKDAVNPSNQSTAETMLNDLPELYKLAKQVLIAQAGSDDTISSFIDFHLDELPDYVPTLLPDLFQTNNKNDITPEIFINKLQLKGSIFGEKEGSLYLTLDFTLGKELSDELLVVEFDQHKNITRIGHES